MGYRVRWSCGVLHQRGLRGDFVYDWGYLREQGFGSAFDQDWDDVVPVAIL